MVNEYIIKYLILLIIKGMQIKLDIFVVVYKLLKIKNN